MDLTVEKQEWMLANVLSGGTFVNTVFDGVMGLATAGMVGGAKPFFHNLRDQGKLTNPWFSMYYSNDDTRPGQMIFGGVDEALIVPGESLVWHLPGPSYPNYWTVQLERLEVGGKAVYKKGDGGSGYGGTNVAEAMVDSGTSLIMIPSSYVSDMSVFAVNTDCSNLGSQPEVAIYVKRSDGATGKYVLTPQEYTVNRGGSCLTGIISGGVGSIMVLGDVFVRKYYTAFNFEKGSKAGQVGWAPANQNRL